MDNGNNWTYVHPDSAQPPGGPPGYGQQPQPPRRSRATRVIGIIALVLTVTVLFAALGGAAVYYLMGGRPAETGPGPGSGTQPQQTQPAETVPQTEVTKPPLEQDDLLMPHFSLADAAARYDAAKKTMTVMEIAAQGKPAVVAITTEMSVTDIFGQVYRPTAAGSGFIISRDGYIVTNNHVIENAETITVVLDNDDAYPASLVGGDPSNDLAVIKIDATGLPTVVLGESEHLQVGELAVAIGNPLGELSGTVTAGIISALDRVITLSGSSGSQRLHLLQTDAAINSGNSGGALFNSFGEVIGINTAKRSATGVEGIGFAIPVDHAKPIIESLIQFGYVRGRPKIGLAGRNVSAQMAEYYKLTEGIYVVEVERKSAADKAGLLPKDIITGANGEKTLTVDELNDVKNKLLPGDKMVLDVVRDNKQLQVEVVLEEELPDEFSPASSRP